MTQLETWKQVACQSGVGRIRKLLAQYRLDLAVPGAPPALAIKLYEKQDGRFEAVPSYMLAWAPPKAKTAAMVRPVAKPPGATGAATKAWDPPSPGYASEQEALSQTVQMLIQAARLAKNATWAENPGF